MLQDKSATYRIYLFSLFITISLRHYFISLYKVTENIMAMIIIGSVIYKKLLS